MMLSVADRLTLLNILPAQGDLTTVRLVHQLRTDLGFTEDELERYELTEEDGVVQWNQKKAQPAEIELGPRAKVLIADQLKSLSDQKRLSEQHLEVWDRFVEESE